MRRLQISVLSSGWVEVLRLTNWASSQSVWLNVNQTKTIISHIGVVDQPVCPSLWLPSVWSDVKQWWLCWNVLVPSHWVMSWKDNGGSTVYCLVQYWAGRYQLTQASLIFPYWSWRWLVKFTRIPPFIPAKMRDLHKHVNQLWDCKWAEQSITLILVGPSGLGPSSIRLKFCSVHTFILLHFIGDKSRLLFPAVVVALHNEKQASIIISFLLNVSRRASSIQTNNFLSPLHWNQYFTMLFIQPWLPGNHI